MANKIYGHKVTKQIIALYAEGKSHVEIAKELDIHPSTVSNRLKKYKNILKRKELEQEEEIADIIDQISGNIPSEIAHKILKIMNNEENLELEFIERGFDPLNRILGTMLDKVLKLYELKQQKAIEEDKQNQHDGFFEAMQETMERIAKKANSFEDLVDQHSLEDDEDVVS